MNFGYGCARVPGARMMMTSEEEKVRRRMRQALDLAKQLDYSTFITLTLRRWIVLVEGPATSIKRSRLLTNRINRSRSRVHRTKLKGNKRMHRSSDKATRRRTWCWLRTHTGKIVRALAQIDLEWLTDRRTRSETARQGMRDRRHSASPAEHPELTRHAESLQVAGTDGLFGTTLPPGAAPSDCTQKAAKAGDVVRLDGHAAAGRPVGRIIEEMNATTFDSLLT